MTLVAVAPNKFAKGINGTGRKVFESYQVLELREALERTFLTDAHLVTYVVEGAERQARINKTGISSFPGRVSVGVFFCDVDNANHAPWNPTLLAAALRDYESIAELQTAGIYHTQHGRRIVQPIVEPIAVGEVEPYLRAWLKRLEDAGLSVDWACRDWTRHFRLPHVKRDGVAFRAPLLALERMTAIPAPVPIEQEPTKAKSASRRVRPVASMECPQEIGDEWKSSIERIAKAVLTVQTEWHTLFLALSGTLLGRGVPPDHLPVIVRAISLATMADSKTEDRVAGARSTVERWAAGEPFSGFGELIRKWPVVADAVGQPVEPVAVAMSLTEVQSQLTEAIRKAPDGLTLIAAECGIGKTAAAIAVAIERAGKLHSSKNAKGTRAPMQSKTAISVDKNSLALQIAQELRGKKIPVRRLFGPLSCKDGKGEPLCKLAEVARPLVAGGQPMQWELCRGRDIERCPHYEECSIREGVEGEADARVILGTHALLSALDGEAGTTGLLVIDEPPSLLESVTLTGEDLDLAERNLGSFEGRYAAAMRPALQAVQAWVSRIAELDTAMPLHAAVRSCEQFIVASDLAQAKRAVDLDDDADAVECALEAPLDERRGKAPPIMYMHLRMARDCAERAERLGTASRVLRTIHHALASDTPVAARVEARAEQRVLVVTRCNEQLAKAVKRDGSVVVTDANADLHLPILKKVVGYEPPLHRFAATDGAPISRTMIRCPTATRTSWIRNRSLEITAVFEAALSALFAWVTEDPHAKVLGLITMQPIEMALRAARGEAVEAAWEPLDDARVRLAHIVQSWPGRIEFGHYGAVRGLNSMADVDCLATLGDPWPNLGLVKSDIAFLGLEQVWERRVEAMCKADLEQAHGRIRAVHRKKPGRALHIGNVRPSGSGWQASQVEVREAGLRVNKKPNVADLPTMIAELGGLAAACALASIDRKTMSLYVTGRWPVPVEVLEELQSWHGDGTSRIVTF